MVVNSLKTVTARLLRRDHAEHLQKFYWKPVLWSRSYFVTSCGGAPLAVIKQYIQQQEAPH
jgi:putative transposase